MLEKIASTSWTHLQWRQTPLFLLDQPTTTKYLLNRPQSSYIPIKKEIVTRGPENGTHAGIQRAGIVSPGHPWTSPDTLLLMGATACLQDYTGSCTQLWVSMHYAKRHVASVMPGVDALFDSKCRNPVERYEMANQDSIPSYIMGTGGFGVSWTNENVKSLTSILKSKEIKRFDTAALYPMHSPGLAEQMLSEFDLENQGFIISTKILFTGDGRGSLSREKMQQSISQSLENLKVKKVDILYAHGPDNETPIDVIAENFDYFHRQGLFDKVGACNFAPEVLSEWFDISSKQGYVKPSIYQGQYNALCRTYEESLFPILRKHNTSFAASSPLAGGFLTGKLTMSNSPGDLIGTRFEVSEANYMGTGFRYWYDKPNFNNAVRILKEACDAHDILLPQAALRWLLFHSALKATDFAVIGPSKPEQLIEYAEAREAGPLPGSLCKMIDDLWDSVGDDAANIVQI